MKDLRIKKKDVELRLFLTQEQRTNLYVWAGIEK